MCIRDRNPQTVNRALKRIRVAHNEAELEKAAKEKREPQLLPPFSCHNLRHTFCTRLCENETLSLIHISGPS